MLLDLSTVNSSQGIKSDILLYFFSHIKKRCFNLIKIIRKWRKRINYGNSERFIGNMLESND